jgi:hypothetical protein
MPYDDATHAAHLLRFQCQRYAKLGWAIERQSADGRTVIMRRTTRPWLSANLLKTVFNVTWAGKDEYIELSFGARRKLLVRPYQP